jgi:hypothetical protein
MILLRGKVGHRRLYGPVQAKPGQALFRFARPRIEMTPTRDAVWHAACGPPSLICGQSCLILSPKQQTKLILRA